MLLLAPLAQLGERGNAVLLGHVLEQIHRRRLECRHLAKIAQEVSEHRLFLEPAFRQIGLIELDRVRPEDRLALIQEELRAEAGLALCSQITAAGGTSEVLATA